MLTTVRFTVDEYSRMAALLGERRTELIDGQIVLMAPMHTAHLTLISRLMRMLAEVNAQGRLLVQLPLVLGKFDEPEPDVVILKQLVDLRKPLAADASLVIEVADSSYEHDRYTKLPRYLAAGVALVWIVNIAKAARPRLESYTTTVGPDTTRSSGVMDLPDDAGVLDLDVLFAGIEGLPADEQPPAAPDRPSQGAG